MRKVFHPVGIIFKGSGWHVTDYDKNGAKGGGSSTLAKDASSTKEKAPVTDE